MRAIFNSLMAALVVVALFWGNCFSCPQLLQAAQKHHCCPHGKTDPNECKTQGLRSFVKAEKVAPVTPAVMTSDVPLPELAVASIRLVVVAPAPPVDTPPNILPLRI